MPTTGQSPTTPRAEAEGLTHPGDPCWGAVRPTTHPPFSCPSQPEARGAGSRWAAPRAVTLWRSASSLYRPKGGKCSAGSSSTSRFPNG